MKKQVTKHPICKTPEQYKAEGGSLKIATFEPKKKKKDEKIEAEIIVAQMEPVKKKKQSLKCEKHHEHCSAEGGTLIRTPQKIEKNTLNQIKPFNAIGGKLNPWTSFLHTKSKETGRKYSDLMKDPKIKEEYKKRQGK